MLNYTLYDLHIIFLQFQDLNCLRVLIYEQVASGTVLYSREPSRWQTVLSWVHTIHMCRLSPQLQVPVPLPKEKETLLPLHLSLIRYQNPQVHHQAVNLEVEYRYALNRVTQAMRQCCLVKFTTV